MDTSAYVQWADGLIAAHFDYGAFFGQYRFKTPLSLYGVWITLVAVARLIAPDAWPIVIVTANAIALFVVARAVIGASPRPVFAAMVMFTAPDLWLFAPYLLSDVVYLAISTLALVAMLSSPVTATGWTALACITRPSAPPLVVLLIARLSGVLTWAVIHERLFWRLVLGIAATTLILHALVIHGAFPLPQRFDAMFADARNLYAVGVIITDRTPALGPLTTLPQIVGLTVLRELAFFSPWAHGFSARHTAVNLLYFVPLYVAVGAAIWHAKDRARVMMLTLFVLLVSGFHAMQNIDYDQRYRLPVLPALMILSTLRDRGSSRS
jgi:hypothetical protein